MILYHILSKKRLEEKLAYAQENNGRLLLTPHLASMDTSNGLIPNYIHCLPSLAGSMPFAGNQSATAIKIKMSSHTKIWRYKGPQDAIDFKQTENDTDVIHTIYDNDKFFKWQEVLLVSNRNIEYWTHDLSEIKSDFETQLEDLKNGKISSDHFFYRDFTIEEQHSVAQLVGHHIGISNLTDESVRKLRDEFNTAYSRLEKLYGIS